MNESKAKATALLDHYITLVMEKAGLRPDSDTHTEIAEIVDHLVEASCDAMEKRLMSHLRATENRLSAAIRAKEKS